MHPVIWRDLQTRKLRFRDQFTSPVSNTSVIHGHLGTETDTLTTRKGNFQLTKRWCLVLSPKFRFFIMNRKSIEIVWEQYPFELCLTFRFRQFKSKAGILLCLDFIYSVRWRPLNTTAKKQPIHLCFSCFIFTLRQCVNYFHNHFLKLVFFLTLF